MFGISFHYDNFDLVHLRMEDNIGQSVAAVFTNRKIFDDAEA